MNPRTRDRPATTGHSPAPEPASTLETVVRGRVRRARRRRTIIAVLAVLVAAGFAASLMFGQTFYPPGDVARVVFGQEVPGASFTVGRLRLPRAVLAVAAGLSFGLAGVTFQTMLRNPLASPDIIGISSGASAAAVFAIVVLGLSGTAVSTVAVVAALAVALLVHALSARRGAAGTRLILIGIGIGAMMDSVTAHVLDRAAEWDLQEAMRRLTGSLNGATWNETVPVLVVLVLVGPLLLAMSRDLEMFRLGEDTAPALGVRVARTRLLALTGAVGLIAFATAAAGPVAFVAFLSGPIAARLVGPNGSLFLPAALVGALLVLVGDFAGQFLLDSRYPVGVVTGVLGAPYLVYLIVRTNRSEGSL
ncbi:iron ABC transporter permease [Nocardiopsis sp. HNM0947]|uniref:Iron ABC transporter permease n=1 Tax=Nocardiopsis coralli TaxID=2772213 RepID=A0ABR9P9Z3_9ACTN|nr:iron ABC transporter permease [Nocardiopsis coralli]